ncbi:anti-sigma factor [Paenibacillus mendelii]|uniref:Anti-sigma factor family protein n=1 Tax=Paenibacillus mendelii TaxID=206163 RepID=A0ABV6JIV6_9BACL|nr:hypothetical protein [Paenibacillus mendelii]MCQ6558371.1 hypothetical protein [Paenibacillus mendelii]
MNCQEGMEYMQRQLDGDLDERESEALISHTRHCQQCAAMFERLQLLSAGLENLPKVTPPYSLVDAILPRLAELPAAEAVRAPVGERTQKQAERVVPVKRWTDRFSMRAFGGVLAAGVVVGLFLVTYQPDGAAKNDASLFDASSANMAMDSGKQSSSSESQSAPDDSEQNADEEVSTSSADRNTSEPEERAIEPRSKSIAGNDSGGSGSTDKGSVESDTYYVGEKQEKDPEAEAEAEPSQGKGNSPNYNFNITKDPSQESESAGNNGNVEEQMDAIHKQGILGETKNPQDESLSPDENYKAVVVQNELHVYHVADNKLLFISDPVSGGVGAIVWAADSKTLTYEARSDNGTVQMVVVDPEAGTSQVQSP